jgi:hypothetical protein
MSLSAKARARLALQQAELVTALMARGEPPPDFDAMRLRAAATSLARKRARAAARAWPGLARALGRRFGRLFAAYTDAATLPRAGGPLADGRAFARWLAARSELPEAGRLQALAVDLRYVGNPDGLALRKGLTCRAAWLRQARRLIVAVRLPWLGEFWLTIPLGWRRHDHGLQTNRTACCEPLPKKG